ncbi:MAG: SdpI family protein [Hyphomicrobiales bacterium]|nr:MAG: SdpI family protein [Hyphomicrobiales bacterium]
MIRFFSPLNLVLLALLAAVTIAGFLLTPAGVPLAVHWGLNGEVDGTLPRDLALLGLPVVLALIWGVLWLAMRYGSGGRPEAAASVMNVVIPAITGLLLLVQALVVLTGMGIAVNVVQAVVIGMAVLQIVLGNVMPKSQPNWIAGIRINSTLSDPANWTATHRFAGLLLIVAGVLLLAAALLLPVGVWLLVAALAAWLLPLGLAAAYSQRFAHTHQRTAS